MTAVTLDAAAPARAVTMRMSASMPPVAGELSDLLLELAATLTRQGKRVAVLARSALQPMLNELTWITAAPDVQRYAHDLYANLRRLDSAGCDAILVEQLPQRSEWAAVNDRLFRAAAGSKEPSTS